MNLKINIKRPQITREEIAANKDFGEVLKMYRETGKHKDPFYKRSWFYAGFSAAAAIVAAVIIYVAPTSNRTSALVASLVKPPVQHVDITSSQYAVNVDKGTTITYRTGSVVKIPPKAFVDKSGKSVEGKVDITYREFSEPVDFFISGIPMKYDSAGVRYDLESAAMVEIHASQNGQELNLNPEATLDIDLASHQSGKQFNLYHFDSQKGQWMFSGKELQDNAVASNTNEEKNEGTLAADASAVKANCEEEDLVNQSPVVHDADSKLEHIQFEIKKSEEALKHLAASRPFEPKAETKGHQRFSVDVSNIQDFPELAIYNDIMFQVADEKNFDKKQYNADWDAATLSKKAGGYLLTLHNEDGTVSYSVRPVFEGEGYITAQKIYKAKVAEYEENLVERKALEGEKQQELNALAEVVTASRETEVKRIKEQGETKESASNKSNPGNLTFHSITVHGCGIWSLATLALPSNEAVVNARFTDEQGKEIKFADGNIYLVEKGRNVLFTFNENSSLSFNPEKQNTIWGVTADNKIAIFRTENVKDIAKTTGSYTFKMQVSDVDLASEQQVEYYLNI